MKEEPRLPAEQPMCRAASGRRGAERIESAGKRPRFRGARSESGVAPRKIPRPYRIFGGGRRVRWAANASLRRRRSGVESPVSAAVAHGAPSSQTVDRDAVEDHLVVLVRIRLGGARKPPFSSLFEKLL